MTLTKNEIQTKLSRGEQVFAFATGLTITTENYSTSSPHISGYLQPTFGEIRFEKQRLMFFKEKANQNGFVSSGRLFSGVSCFDHEMEALTYFNEKVREHIQIKEREIESANNLIVEQLRG